MNGRKARSLVVTVLVAIGALMITSLGLIVPASAVPPSDPDSPDPLHPLSPAQIADGWHQIYHRTTKPDGSVIEGTLNYQFKPGVGVSLTTRGFPYNSNVIAWAMPNMLQRSTAMGGAEELFFVPCSSGVAAASVGADPYGHWDIPGYNTGWWHVYQSLSCGSSSATPPATVTPPTPSMKAAKTFAQVKVYCASIGKIAKRLKGKALRFAQKHGKAPGKCAPPKKRHKKRRPSITSRVYTPPLRR